MATVELDEVTKVYPNGVEAVQNVSLEIGDGELMVLVGPSGCGKTTVLRMVAGLEEISDGEVRIGGRVVNDVSPKDRDIAMVFQNYALYPHMTVAQNIGFGLKMRRLPRAEVELKVRNTAKMLGLSQWLERKPAQLSGGQRQRVAMGRAIVREPKVFLMDEPLSNLDAKLRVQMRAEVSRIQRRLGVSMLYVTHDQTEAMTMGDRVAVLLGGVLQQCAAPQELYERPINIFVAAFIGSPAMNLYEGALTPEGTAVSRVPSDSSSPRRCGGRVRRSPPTGARGSWWGSARSTSQPPRQGTLRHCRVTWSCSRPWGRSCWCTSAWTRPLLRCLVRRPAAAAASPRGTIRARPPRLGVSPGWTPGPGSGLASGRASRSAPARCTSLTRTRAWPSGMRPRARVASRCPLPDSR